MPIPNRSHCWLAATSAALTASALLAAPPAPSEVGNPKITAPEIVANVKYLASEELQGRGSGTRGNDLAADYIAARFQAAGLKPAGEKGTYFQRFPVLTGVKMGSANRLSYKTGSGSAEVPVQADWMPLSYSKNGSAEAPVAFAGYGISEPSLGYDDYAGLDVKGKIVVVLRYTPDGNVRGKFADYATLYYKAMTAREKGAAGMLLLTGPASQEPESLGTFTLESPSADCGIPVAFVKRSVVEKILEPAQANLQDLQVAMAHGKPKSFPVPGARVSMRIDVVRQTAPTRNVLGVIEGSDPKLKNEYVVIGAHYDHLGFGGSHSLEPSPPPGRNPHAGAEEPPQIHHGADDNASGTAALLEAAHYLAANRKKLARSVVFMGFSGEEMGLLGSSHWVKEPTIPVERVVAMLNLDMVGRMRNNAVHVVGASSSPAWAKLLENADRTYGVQTRIDNGNGFGGSDHQSFLSKGIPVLFFFTGTHADYHRPSDTWEKVNAEGAAKIAQLTADTALKVSALPQRPQFVKVQDSTPAANPGFRVYLGTIPDYSAEVVGVRIEDVRDGSPAQKGGIRPGDVLVEFGGKTVRNVQEYTTVLGTAKADVPVKIAVMRGGQRVDLTITPAARR